MESPILCALFSTEPVIIGKPHFASTEKTMPKISVIHTSNPKSGVMSDICYFAIRQTTMANRQAPSMRALTMMAVIL